MRDPERALRAGESAFQSFPRMLELAARLGWSIDDVEFMRDTFAILLLARRYYFEPHNPQLETEILNAKAVYKQRWPRPSRQRYRMRTSRLKISISNAQDIALAVCVAGSATTWLSLPCSIIFC